MARLKIPDQSGRTAVVTGANTGLGYEVALGLAKAGAEVVLACRSVERGESAAARIAKTVPGSAGRLRVVALDLADLDSVRSFPARLGDGAVDVLVNNAGIMIPPFGRTPEGFESQFGVNVVGHYALTGLLLPRLEAAPAGRVVWVASIAHLGGRIDFENLRGEKPYDMWREYRQSKLGDIMLALEMDRRLRAAGLSVRSVAAHPGMARTELTRSRFLYDLGARLVTQSAARGAKPLLHGAVADVPGGSYWGPVGPKEYWWSFGPAKVSRRARDEAVAARLWALCEEATGVSYEGLVRPA
ncbi:MAG: oxidoreductase [Thermoplasmatota archaeon]